MPVSITHTAPLITIRRARTLPAPGRVLVSIGQTVNATDPIAECSLPGRHFLLDIRRALGIERVSTVQKILERTVGQQVKKGDVVAQTGGLFSRVVRSPSDGEVVAIQKGQVLIQLPQEPYQMTAGISGQVVEIIPELGAIIEANGALVQGVWGNNHQDVGVLNILSKSGNDELLRPEMDMTMRGAVVVAGYAANADSLEAAGELPVRGLILGGMTASLIPTAQKMEYPIVVLEGFGRIGMRPSAFELLKSSAKRDVSINASWKPEQGERPEIFIPLPAAGTEARVPVDFEAGQTVRITKAPYFGQVGTLLQIRPGLTTIPSGLRVPAAEVHLLTNELVTVPLANLTLID